MFARNTCAVQVTGKVPEGFKEDMPQSLEVTVLIILLKFRWMCSGTDGGCAGSRRIDAVLTRSAPLSAHACSSAVGKRVFEQRPVLTWRAVGQDLHPHMNSLCSAENLPT